MNEKELDLLLTQAGRRECPELPFDFSAGVWREIRRREAESSGGLDWWGEWLVWVLRPVPVAVSLGLAILVGSAGPGLFEAGNRGKAASAALSLGVFNPRTQDLTLIADK